MQVTSVGRCISVGADMTPAATSHFALVVLANNEQQHHGERYPEGVEVLRCPLRDEDEPPSLAEIKMAHAAAERISRMHAPVLVTCEEGMNRSLWVAGMALVLTGQQPTGKAAREYLEKLRGKNAFRNTHLRNLLDGYYPQSMIPMRSIDNSPKVAG